MWRLLSEEFRLYRPVLLISWAVGIAIFGLILSLVALLGDANDRTHMGTLAAQLPLVLLVASMVAGFIVTGTDRSESRVRLLMTLPVSLRQVGGARILLPVAMLLLGLLVAHAGFALLLAFQGQPFALERHLNVDFMGLQMLLWVLVALVVREVIELHRARGWRAALGSAALLIATIVFVGWLLVGPIESLATRTAVVGALDAGVGVGTLAMFCRRADFTR